MIEYLKSEGYRELREIEGKGICGLMKFVFTTGLVIGMNSWDGKGDPSGNWIKYKGTGGERENPNNINMCLNCNKK